MDPVTLYELAWLKNGTVPRTQLPSIPSGRHLPCRGMRSTETFVCTVQGGTTQSCIKESVTQTPESSRKYLRSASAARGVTMLQKSEYLVRRVLGSSLLSVCALIQLLWPTEVSAGILCGTKPPGFTCGTWTCIEGSWELVPKPGKPHVKTLRGMQGPAMGPCQNYAVDSSTGTVYPNFYVTHVVYAPPESPRLCRMRRSNAYGSTTTTEGSFKAAPQLGVSNSGGFLFFAQGGLTLTAGRNGDSSDTKSTDVTTRYTSSTRSSAPKRYQS
jgi:hypothetical protein